MACHNYESVHGNLPPAVVYGPDGTPLYSWRVLILPYIEQQELFDQFRKNEPWDSPHNIRLVERMPATYAPPRYNADHVPPHHTICHVFVGKGTAFDGRIGLNHSAFPDGMSNTVLIVEAGDPVPWSKPEEIPFDPERPPPRPRGPFRDGYRACLADGSVRFIKYDTSEATLRAAITRNGEDETGSDW